MSEKIHKTDVQGTGVAEQVSTAPSAPTKQEMDYIKDNYPKKTIAEIARFLGLSIYTVTQTLEANGLLKSQQIDENGQRVKNHEHYEFIEQNYGSMKAKDIAEKLGIPERTVRSIAADVGVTRKSSSKAPLSTSEKKFLKSNYSRMTKADIAKRLRRTYAMILAACIELGLENPSGASQTAQEGEPTP